MVGEVPVRVCLGELRDSTEPGAAQALARERRIALLGTAGVASGLVAAAVDGQDGDRRRSLELFEALIELARIDEESRGRLGARFLEEAATSIEGLALLDGIAPAETHGLTMAYARAEVETPEALVERLLGQIGPLRESGRLPFDPDTEIDALRPMLESEPWTLHRILDERIGVFPDEARAAFACEVACRDEEGCGRIALYWLLDRSEEVRVGVANGFLERALRGIVEPVSAALVPLVRNWMPADPARAVLDQALSALTDADITRGRGCALTSLDSLTPSTVCLGTQPLVCVKMNYRILIGPLTGVAEERKLHVPQCVGSIGIVLVAGGTTNIANTFHQPSCVELCRDRNSSPETGLRAS